MQCDGLHDNFIMSLDLLFAWHLADIKEKAPSKVNILDF